MAISRYAPFALSLVLACVAAAGRAEASFRIIVNAGNPVTSISQAEVSNAFLKRMKRWVSGGEVLPVDQEASSATRAAFSTSVLGRKVTAIRSHWQREFFSGRGTPPPELPSDQDIIAFVASNPGAIGYISSRTRMPSTVKAIEITP